MKEIRRPSTWRNSTSLLMIAMILCAGMAKAASRADDVIAIENLQGRYNHCLSSGALELIPGMFAQNDPDVSISFPHNDPSVPIIGLAAITAEFQSLKKMVTEQGGFMGTHLITTPVVSVSSDGKTARGSWMTIGITVQGPAFKHASGTETPQPPYKTLPSIGRYDQSFIKEHGVWKFKHFTWTTYAGLPPFPFDPAAVGRGWANTPMKPGSKPKPWPLDPIDEMANDQVK
jgi:hypothetical protein